MRPRVVVSSTMGVNRKREPSSQGPGNPDPGRVDVRDGPDHAGPARSGERGLRHNALLSAALVAEEGSEEVVRHVGTHVGGDDVVREADHHGLVSRPNNGAR